MSMFVVKDCHFGIRLDLL